MQLLFVHDNNNKHSNTKFTIIYTLILNAVNETNQLITKYVAWSKNNDEENAKKIRQAVNLNKNLKLLLQDLFIGILSIHQFIIQYNSKYLLNPNTFI